MNHRACRPAKERSKQTQKRIQRQGDHQTQRPQSASIGRSEDAPQESDRLARPHRHSSKPEATRNKCRADESGDEQAKRIDQAVSVPGLLFTGN